MASYPVIFDINQQETYNRVHIAIRILIVIILSILGGVLGWLFGLLYLAIPVLAAIMISQKGASRYFAEAEDNMLKWLRWVAVLYAYLFLLTDKLPNEDPKTVLRFDVQPEGEPTAGGVLLRIILSIPHFIVLGLLGIVGFILMVIAAIMILVQESYPKGIFDFLRGLMRWYARVYGYMAGFAQAYPPFALDTGPEGGESVAPGVATTPPPSGTSSGGAP